MIRLMKDAWGRIHFIYNALIEVSSPIGIMSEGLSYDLFSCTLSAWFSGTSNVLLDLLYALHVVPWNLKLLS